MTWRERESGVMVPLHFADAPPARPELGEVASTLDGRDITRGYVDPMRVELPDDTVLMQRGGGDYTLYREILRDDKVKAALEQRFRAVISRPFEVRPGGDKRIDKQAAKDLESQIKTLNWDRITEMMLYGVFYGYAVAEAMLGLEGNRVVLSGIKVRDRRRFGFDGLGRLRLKTSKQPEGELLPERKFWAYSCGADHDDAPYGLGLAHWLYWPVWMKRNGIKFWAVYLEKFGTPTGVGWFPPGTSKGEQNKLLAALRAIQRDSAIILPDGMRAELLEATRSGTADHEAFTRMMNEAITILIMGQSASTQGTAGKLGNEDLQGDVRTDITAADADLVCMSFNATIARWLTEWNFPGAAYPQVWRVMDEPEDQAQAAERDERLSHIGYKPTLERITEVYGEGYEPVGPTPPAPDPAVPVPAEFADPAKPDDADALDAAIAAELADWQPVMSPLLDPVEAAMRASLEANETAEQFLSRLPALVEQMDADPLADRLARLSAVARMAGSAGLGL